MEIERKFLVDVLPEDLESCPVQRLEQAYLSTQPVIRVRRAGDQYTLTCKGAGLLSREEYELPLTEEEYCRLLAKTEGTPIAKDRYRVPLEGRIVELDIFLPPFAPLQMAEVEFPTEAEALAFQPPAWFGREVTYERAYTNASLSRQSVESQNAAIRPGRYRHFKGRDYRVLWTAKHSETQELMVVYQALYGERGIWVRPASMWNEEVTRDGKTFRRFTFVEPEGGATCLC